MKEREEEQRFEEVEELDQAKRKPRKIEHTFKKAAKKRYVFQGEDEDDEA